MDERAKRTVLCVGGLDPSGGAGILVDCAAVRAVGLHCAAVVAAATVQDGVSFASMDAADPARVRASMAAVFARQDVGAVKTGALCDAAIVESVAESFGRGKARLLVVDPVLRTSSGGALLDVAGLEALRDMLLPLTTLVTPNIHEAAAIAREPVEGVDDMARAARRILEMGAGAVLVKGGHLDGDPADLLATRDGGVRVMRGARIGRDDVRGTGCFLAAFAAGRLTLGDSIEAAVEAARGAVRAAIEGAYRAGAGPPMLGVDGRRAARD